MNKTTLDIYSEKITRPLTLAYAADFHDGKVDAALEMMQGCDAILIGGDLVNRHRRHGWHRAVAFLEQAPKVAPTFYNIGNHERRLPELKQYWPHVEKSDVVLLDDAFVSFEGIILGALSSVRRGKNEPSREAQLAQKKPFLREMAAQKGYKLLLCHHPEYYAQAVRSWPIDLTLSGHAHGGQVRIAGQGIYSPGQGLLPKLTSGFYEQERLFVSRGMTNSASAPRLWCPCELVLVKLHPMAEKEKGK